MRIQFHIGNTGKGTQRGALLPTVQPHHCLSCVLCGVHSIFVVHLHQDGTRQNFLRLSSHLIPGVEEDEGAARAGRCGEERGDGDGGGEAARRWPVMEAESGCVDA